MPYQELVDIGGKLSTHQKFHYYLVVKISKPINTSDPKFLKVLHAENEIRYRLQKCSRLKLPRRKTNYYINVKTAFSKVTAG